MPIIGGRELARQLTAIRPDLRVLYMSGYTPQAILHHGELEANTFFIQKPFTPSSLAAKIREVLDHSQWGAPRRRIPQKTAEGRADAPARAGASGLIAGDARA